MVIVSIFVFVFKLNILLFGVRLVGMMDGRIWLESEVGNGTIFYFLACFEAGGVVNSWCDVEMTRKSTLKNVHNKQRDAYFNHSIMTQAPSWKCASEPFLIANLKQESRHNSSSNVDYRVATMNSMIGSCEKELNTTTNASQLCDVREAGKDFIKAQSVKSFGISSSEGQKSTSQFSMLKGLKVLLAEDNVVNQKVACHQLKRFGTEVDVVSDGQQCLDALQKGWDKYDLILMDVQVSLHSLLYLLRKACMCSDK